MCFSVIGQLFKICFRMCACWCELIISGRNDPMIIVALTGHDTVDIKEYIVKHNSSILLRCISYIVSFNDMFRL
jgi:hypothetical protein